MLRSSPFLIEFSKHIYCVAGISSEIKRNNPVSETSLFFFAFSQYGSVYKELLTYLAFSFIIKIGYR